MKIVIIEDELPASKRLTKMIMEVAPDATILATLTGIANAVEWFGEHAMPDLVFMDIHLSDGSGFELLRQVNITAPIIFTTAYDQYAIEAFKTKSIDYLMKPIRKEDLAAAMDKLRELRTMFAEGTSAAPASSPGTPHTYKQRFVFRIGEQLKTLATDEIAYCYSESKATFARSTSGRNYPMDHNLDTLETMLDPKQFFRINRQYLISLDSIEEMRAYTKSRVIIKLKPPVKEDPVVSAERSADFKMWLGGEL